MPWDYMDVGIFQRDIIYIKGYNGRMVMRYTGVSWNIMGFNGL
jgi:hypothetical protein